MAAAVALLSGALLSWYVITVGSWGPNGSVANPPFGFLAFAVTLGVMAAALTYGLLVMGVRGHRRQREAHRGRHAGETDRR